MLRQHVYYAITFVPGQFVPDVWDFKADQAVVNYDSVSIIDSHGWEVSENQWHRNTLFQILELEDFNLNISDNVKANTIGSAALTKENINLGSSISSPSFGSAAFSLANIDTSQHLSVLKLELKSATFTLNLLEKDNLIQKIPTASIEGITHQLDYQSIIVDSPIASFESNVSGLGNQFLTGRVLRTISFNTDTLSLVDGDNLSNITAQTYVSNVDSTVKTKFSNNDFVTWITPNQSVNAKAANLNFVSWLSKTKASATKVHITNWVTWFDTEIKTSPAFKKETTTFVQSFEGNVQEQSSIRGIQ